MKPQTERVLKSLRAAGPAGVTRVDWLGDRPTPDGGDAILNFPARILEIRQAGFDVVRRGRRDACSVYVLVEPPVLDGAIEPAARLFQPAPVSAIGGDAA